MDAHTQVFPEYTDIVSVIMTVFVIRSVSKFHYGTIPWCTRSRSLSPSRIDVGRENRTVSLKEMDFIETGSVARKR